MPNTQQAFNDQVENCCDLTIFLKNACCLMLEHSNSVGDVGKVVCGLNRCFDLLENEIASIPIPKER